MNEIYYSSYSASIYDPIYLPPIVFCDEETLEGLSQKDIPQITVA